MITLDWQTGEGYGYFYKEVSVVGGATSDYVRLEHDTITSVALYPNNRAKVQYSLSNYTKLDAGTADWIDWPLGSINRNDADTIIGVASAIRLVSDNGAARMEVLAK